MPPPGLVWGYRTAFIVVWDAGAGCVVPLSFPELDFVSSRAWNVIHGKALVGTAGGQVMGESITAIPIGANTAATDYDFAALIRAGCRLNTASVRAALQAGPNGTIPVLARAVSVSSSGPMARYFPTLAARLQARAGTKAHATTKAPAATHPTTHAPYHDTAKPFEERVQCSLP